MKAVAPTAAECSQLVELFNAGRHAELESQARMLVEQYPDSGFAWKVLGLSFLAQGKEALPALQKATQLLPEDASAHLNLGVALNDLGRLEEALTSYQRALQTNPDYAMAHSNLGNTLKELGRFEEAVASFQRALEINPVYAEAHLNLGNVLKDLGRFGEAQASFQRALEIKPDFVEAHYNRGAVLQELGQLDEAMAIYRRVLAIKPDFPEAHSNLLFAQLYAEGYAPAQLFAEHLAFARQFEAPLKGQWRAYENSPDPGRRLKIGYVSADFRQHSVAYFIEPVLAHHDKSEVDVTCYSNSLQHDAVTSRFKGYADRWLDCARLGDEELAQRIRDDGIDILVDLAGHTRGNRLLTFARKPAPVQVTWLGYPSTTGLSAMDYRITDIHAEPPGLTEHLNVETLWRLPGFFCCYRAHENSPAVIDHPPSKDNGYITFGCFNNFAKVTDAVLSLWAKILIRLPSARLLLEIVGLDRARFRAETEARLERLGLPLARVILKPRSPANQFVLYNRIDIALDPFPCNGGTTSLDAMWMGVPLVTLAGSHFVSRMGVSILTNAGLPELIAGTAEDYVAVACRLASDSEMLRKTRHHLRQKVAGSPLMDEAGFTRQLEAAYRGMWQAYCVRRGAKS